MARSSVAAETDYPGPVRPMLGARLRTAAEAVHATAHARLIAAGFDELRPAHFTLLKFPGPHGARPSELAAHVGLRKQALNPLLNDLEAWGYLVRIGDDQDRRGRIVHLTERGFALVRVLRETLEAIESGLRARAGDAAVNEFLAVLDEVGQVAAAVTADDPATPDEPAPFRDSLATGSTESPR
jgi:DNA-binding MarR family transcriptional regulator